MMKLSVLWLKDESVSKINLDDYFSTGHGRLGLFYLSVSPELGGRLFIPNGHQPSLLNSMWRGNILKMLTIGEYIVVVFDDHTDSPFVLDLEPMQYELEEATRERYPSPWFSFVALGPDGPLHEWLCRWCKPHEEKYWDSHVPLEEPY